MNEEKLRELVREALARRIGEPAGATVHVPLALTEHASHHRWTVPASDGACLIEPSVECVHCGYCQSHGH